MPKISIIVPVYNSSEYLSGCIDSILNQSESDFELLLIDDGSTDGSGNICDLYKKKDSRVKVIHKTNGGVSSARNLGLDHASGKMICFIDSDDTVDQDYLENFSIIDDEDYVIGGMHILDNDFLKPIMTNKEIFSDFNRFWMQSRQWWAPVCCLSKKIIDDNYLRYSTELKLGEDGLFNLIFLSKCKKIRRTKYNGYHYNSGNADSASHKLYLDRLKQQIELVYELEKYFDKKDLQRAKWDLWNEVINHFIVKGINNKDIKIKKIAKRKLKETYNCDIFRESIQYIRNTGSLDERIMSYFMGFYKFRLYKPVMKMVQILHKFKVR